MSLTRRKMRLLRPAIPQDLLYSFTSITESTRLQETRIVRVCTSQQCIAVFHRGLPFPSPELISLYGCLHYTELGADNSASTDDPTLPTIPDKRWICAAGICNVFENKALQRNRYLPYVIRGVGVFDRLPSFLSFMILIANNCLPGGDSNTKHDTPTTSGVDETGAQLTIDRPSLNSTQLQHCNTMAPPALPQFLFGTTDVHLTPVSLQMSSKRSTDGISAQSTSLGSPVLSSQISSRPVRKRGRPRSHTQTSHSDKENTASRPFSSSYTAKTTKSAPNDSNSSLFPPERLSSSRIRRPSLRKLLSTSNEASLVKHISHVHLFAPDLQHPIGNEAVRLAAPSSDDHHMGNVDHVGDTTEEDTPTPLSRDSGSVYHPDSSPVDSPLRIGGSRRKTNNGANGSMGVGFAGMNQKRKGDVHGRVSAEVQMKSLSLPKRSLIVGNLDELEEEDSFKIE